MHMKRSKHSQCAEYLIHSKGSFVQIFTGSISSPPNVNDNKGYSVL